MRRNARLRPTAGRRNTLFQQLHLGFVRKMSQTAKVLPPAISLRSLRQHTNKTSPSAQLPHVLGQDARCAVRDIEASFKRFGCVCVPVDDLDVPRVSLPSEVGGSCMLIEPLDLNLNSTVLKTNFRNQAINSGKANEPHCALGKIIFCFLNVRSPD